MVKIELSVAQKTFDNIYQEYNNEGISRQDAIQRMIHSLEHGEHSHEGSITKCLTPLIMLLNSENMEALHLEKATTTDLAFDTTYLSSSGKFRIHYYTTGSDAVPLEDINNNMTPDYIEEVAAAADSSYTHEITNLGFTDPILDGTVYDIFVKDLQFYGLTNRSTSGSYACNNLLSGTCIYIENDFVGFPENTDPEGSVIGAIKVTMAHEFKHAIQYAQNNWQGDSDRWAEMDATLMEEVVYDDVNDYYNYISASNGGIFSTPQDPLIAGSYEDITWALYFHERFGDNFWPNVWDVIEDDKQIDLIEAIESELSFLPVSYDASVLESYMWHFASGTNYARNDYGFNEAFEYPNPSITETITELQQELTASIPINRFSARYYLAELVNASDGLVKLNYTISSENIQIGLIGYFKDGSIEIHLELGNEDKLQGNIETNWAWNNVNKIGMVVMNKNALSAQNFSYQFTNYFDTLSIINSLNGKQIQLSQNYPNPFNPNTKIILTIPKTQNIKLDIFDSQGKHIQTIYEGTVTRGIRPFEFNANSFSSGIYIYRLTTEYGIQTKKMTLVK